MIDNMVKEMKSKLALAAADYRKRKNTTYQQIAAEIGVDYQTLYDWRIGKWFPSEEHWDKLREMFGLTVLEILGRDNLPSPSPSSDPQPAPLEHQAVPIYETVVVGGPPEEVYSERAKSTAFIPAKALKSKNPEHLACFEVKGESMMPIVRRGALVCVDLSARPERMGDNPAKTPKGSIWVARKDNGLVIKYLHIENNVIVFVSANTEEGVSITTDPEAIVGRVVWIGQGV